MPVDRLLAAAVPAVLVAPPVADVLLVAGSVVTGVGIAAGLARLGLHAVLRSLPRPPAS